jgi:hypothetical protein
VGAEVDGVETEMDVCDVMGRSCDATGVRFGVLCW